MSGSEHRELAALRSHFSSRVGSGRFGISSMSPTNHRANLRSSAERSEQPASGGMIRDTETSWICDEANAAECAARGLAEMEAGEPRNKVHDHSQCRIESA